MKKGALKTAMIIAKKYHQQLMMMFFYIQNKVNWAVGSSWDDKTSLSSGEFEEIQLPLPSISFLSSVLFDDERKDIELINSPRKWELKYNTTQ